MPVITKAAYEAAIANHHCVLCGEPAIKFVDEFTHAEYLEMGFCDPCQDGFFVQMPDGSLMLPFEYHGGKVTD